MTTRRQLIGAAVLLAAFASSPVPLSAQEKPAELMSGPSVPSAAMDQDSVDDLLADLGF